MMKNVLQSIPGIEWYPIIALLFFVGFFGTLIVWFFRADRSRLTALSLLPFDQEPTPLPSSSTNENGGPGHGTGQE